MMTRLDIITLRDVLLFTLVCALGLTFLFSALSLYQIVNRFEVTPRIGTLLSFAPSLWISLLPLTLPISALFAATLVYGRMRAEQELLLLSASGVAPWRPYVMVIPLGILAGVISWFGVSEYGPDAYAQRHSLQRQALADFIDTPPQGARELRFPGKGGPDPSIDISYSDVDGGRYEDLRILVYNDLGLLASLSADSATISYQRYSGVMTLANCYQPRLIEFNPKTGRPTGTPMVAAKVNELRVPFDFGSDEDPDSSKALRTVALWSKVQGEIADGKDKRGAAAELVRRFGLSFAGFLLPLLGALLASLVNHPNRLFAIGVGVIPSAVGYYPLMTASTTLAEKGVLPVIAASAIAPGVTIIAIILVLGGMTRGRWV